MPPTYNYSDRKWYDGFYCGVLVGFAIFAVISSK